jgi:hypothetical protein
VVEEVTAAGVGVEKFLVLFGREGEVTVDLAAVEAQVKDAPRGGIGRDSQELSFEGLPVQPQAFCVNPDCAHDSEIVGTISLRWSERHAASVAGELPGNRFHGSKSAIRLMG